MNKLTCYKELSISHLYIREDCLLKVITDFKIVVLESFFFSLIK